MMPVIMSKSRIRPIYIQLASPTPADITVTFRDYAGRKGIVVVCFNSASIVVPTQGVSYIANQRFANGDNLVGGDGGALTSTWCRYVGVLPASMLISNLSSRTIYKVAVLEYTDDVLLNYSQELRGLNTAESNYKSITTRR
jgi:hypothetical protein